MAQASFDNPSDTVRNLSAGDFLQVESRPEASQKFLSEVFTPHEQNNRVMGIVPRKLIAPESEEMFKFTDPPYPNLRKLFERTEIEEKPLNKPATTQEKEAVRARMDGAVNELIPDGEKAILKKFRDGVIDGNAQAIEQTVESLKNNPELMHKLVRELNREFAGEGSHVKFSMTENNKMLMSPDGSNGVEFGSGKPQARGTTSGADGYIYPSQAASTSKPVEAVMESATQSTCAPRETYAFPELYKTRPYRPSYGRDPLTHMID